MDGFAVNVPEKGLKIEQMQRVAAAAKERSLRYMGEKLKPDGKPSRTEGEVCLAVEERRSLGKRAALAGIEIQEQNKKN